MKDFIESFLSAVFYRRTIENQPQVVEKIREMMKKNSPVAVSGTLLALAGRTDTTASLYSIKVPTLILVGQHDNITPPSAAHALKERIPTAELHVLSNAAHMSNIENTEEFNRHLLSFLARLKR